MNLPTKDHCKVAISNLSSTPKLIQKYYKLSKIERNRINEITYFFFLQNYLFIYQPCHWLYNRKNSKIGQDYKRGLQKSEYPNSLVNGKNLET